ncbi:MAG: transposase domain-containing protein [Amphritea sp.]
MFSNTPSGAENNVIITSLIFTARASNLNPSRYLRELFQRLPNRDNGDDLNALMLWKIVLD